MPGFKPFLLLLLVKKHNYQNNYTDNLAHPSSTIISTIKFRRA